MRLIIWMHWNDTLKHIAISLELLLLLLRICSGNMFFDFMVKENVYRG